MTALTNEVVTILARATYGEVRGEGNRDNAAVAYVILNRWRHTRRRDDHSIAAADFTSGATHDRTRTVNPCCAADRAPRTPQPSTFSTMSFANPDKEEIPQ